MVHPRPPAASRSSASCANRRLPSLRPPPAEKTRCAWLPPPVTHHRPRGHAARGYPHPSPTTAQEDTLRVATTILCRAVVFARRPLAVPLAGSAASSRHRRHHHAGRDRGHRFHRARDRVRPRLPHLAAVLPREHGPHRAPRVRHAQPVDRVRQPHAHRRRGVRRGPVRARGLADLPRPPEPQTPPPAGVGHARGSRRAGRDRWHHRAHRSALVDRRTALPPHHRPGVDGGHTPACLHRR